eukprot:g25802.t1
MTASAADVVCAQATSGVNPKDFQRRDLDQQHATSEFSYLFDKGLCRENDFLRVGTIYGDYLQDGQSMEEVVNQIVNGDINVDETDWLILDVFKMKSPQTKKLKLYSADNRRLKILKLAQEIDAGRSSRARVRYMNADCRKFLMHFSTKNDGKTIEVKPKRQRMA